MGNEVNSFSYSAEDVVAFEKRVQEETDLLKTWFDQNKFQSDVCKTGIELEAWLTNENMLPDPYSETFLEKLNHPQVVPEIAKFNFEINSEPYETQGNVFSKLEDELKDLWHKCINVASADNKVSLLVGTLPTLRAHMLSLEYLASKNRYRIMNDQVMKLRDRKPLFIRLEGKDSLQMHMDSVIAECAATSLQIHLTINQEDAKRYYNASMIASPFMVALCANSPYFFGKELWDESRIAVFEQSVDLESKCKKNSNETTVKRVSLGNKYLKESLFELFEENIDYYPTLLAELDESSDPSELKHLKLHNGTIWRWNRPILGEGKDGQPHLRIEQRTPSSGPTLVDSVANAAFYIGLVDYLATLETPPEDQLCFNDLKNNFYRASRQSLYSKVTWIDGEDHNIRLLIQNELFPHVKKALLARGIDEAEVSYYMDEVIYPRLTKCVNGSIWQKAFIHMHGKRFQELLETYVRNQSRNLPVHMWGLEK